MQKAIGKNHIYSYDLIRIIALLSVIMVHVSAPYVTDPNATSKVFLIGNVFESLSRFGVPFFVMLSGALILDEKRDFPFKKMFRYCTNILVLLYFWSFAYAFIFKILKPALSHEPVSMKVFIEACILGHYHLWYLFMIIGLYLITPILKAFVKKENIKIVQWFLILALGFQFLTPICNFVINRFITSGDVFQTFTNQFGVQFVSQFTAYYLLGWYIANIPIEKKNRIRLYIAGFITFWFTLVFSQTMITPKRLVYNPCYDNLSINILIYSTALFVFLHYYFQKHEIRRHTTLIYNLSQLTFGVYIIHVIILGAVAIIVPKVFGIRNVILLILLNFTITIILSFTAAFIMSKIPFIKKLVKF